MGHKPWDRAWRRASKARERNAARKVMLAEAGRTHYETELAGMDDDALEREALVVLVTFETTNLAYNRDRLLAIIRECRDRDRTDIYETAHRRVYPHPPAQGRIGDPRTPSLVLPADWDRCRWAQRK